MIKVKVAATSANLGPAFDAVGVALQLYDQFRFTPRSAGRLKITVNGPGRELIPTDDSNLAYRALKRVFKRKRVEEPVWSIQMDQGIPPARGLGSSAAAVVAGLVAANKYLGSPYSILELLQMGAELEGHPDNIAPGLLGGIVVCGRQERGQILACKLPARLEGLSFVLAVPDFEMTTAEARTVLPQQVEFRRAVFNISHAALLIAALATGDRPALAAALHDRMHQPYREAVIPLMGEVFQAAIGAGALGSVLSGSGSTILAITERDPEAVGRAMAAVWEADGVHCQVVISDIDLEGASIIE